VNRNPHFKNHVMDPAAVDTEIETTKSERVAKSVIRRLNLTEDPEFIGPGRDPISRLRSLISSPPETATTQDELLQSAIDGGPRDRLKVVCARDRDVSSGTRHHPTSPQRGFLL
jgi:uncharacterized protein involved in exopolysaccharide biosynthesis